MRIVSKPAWLAWMGLLVCGAALGGAFQISPIRIALSGRTPIAVLKVRNEGTEASVMQLQTMAWSQSGNQDIYTPTAELLATPPIFTLPPGGTQIVRVGIRRKVDARRELAYRLFLQEVPVAAAVASEGEVRVALRFGIPVFVAPASAKPPQPLLDWRVTLAPPQALRIAAMNRGEAHVQISGIALNPAAGGPALAEYLGMDYLLPQQGRNWLVPLQQAQAPGAPLKLLAQTDAGELHAEVALEP